MIMNFSATLIEIKIIEISYFFIWKVFYKTMNCNVFILVFIQLTIQHCTLVSPQYFFLFRKMIPWIGCIEQTGTMTLILPLNPIFTCSVLPVGNSGPLETFPYGVITWGVSFSYIMSMTPCYECFGSAYGSWECLTKGPCREIHLPQPKIIKAICPNIWAQTLLNISLMMLKGCLFHFLLKPWGRVFTFPYESDAAVDIFRF